MYTIVRTDVDNFNVCARLCKCVCVRPETPRLQMRISGKRADNVIPTTSLPQMKIAALLLQYHRCLMIPV